ncbi:MAG: hypothetical protein R3F62_18680 [Planctomycetota bacterium]
MIRALMVVMTLGLAPLAFAQDDMQDGDQPTPQAEGDRGGEGEGEGQGERPRGQRGQRGGGFGRGGMGIPVERFKDDLGLTEEQVAQLEALNAQMREEGQKLREAFQNGDREGIREMMQGFREKMQENLKGVLTEEQMKKYEELRETMRGQRGQRGQRGERGERGGRGGGPQLKARLRQQAVEALALSDEEAAVVLPRLDTVLDTRELLQREQDTRRQDFLKKARETQDGDALNGLLAEFRSAQEADQEQVKAAMDQLREVLTLEQEVKLVGLNVLD